MARKNDSESGAGGLWHIYVADEKLRLLLTVFAGVSRTPNRFATISRYRKVFFQEKAAESALKVATTRSSVRKAAMV